MEAGNEGTFLRPHQECLAQCAHVFATLGNDYSVQIIIRKYRNEKASPSPNRRPDGSQVVWTRPVSSREMFGRRRGDPAHLHIVNVRRYRLGNER